MLLFLSFIACDDHALPPAAEYDPVVPVTDDTDDGIEEVGSEITEPCLAEEVRPYDPVEIITYTLDIDDRTLAQLDALGYDWWSYGTTYDQISMFATLVTIDVPGCESILFEEPRVDTGRQMGWQSPYAEASWVVEYNEVHGGQELGGYDDARYWAPAYDGPVNVVWTYEYAMDYVGLVDHRWATWMKFRTTWWGNNQEAIYNALEPIEDDFMARIGANVVWEGYDLTVYPGASAICKAGDCTNAKTRGDACMERLYALSDSSALIAETGDCYDWPEIAAVIALQDWLGHWDGCGSNNCYGYMSGDAANAETWKTRFGITGIDLLLREDFTPVESVDLAWSGGTAGWYCKADTSVGGCRDQYVTFLQSLNALARSGKMEADLREVYALRQSDGVALEGDEDWVETSVAWVTARPDYVDQGIETLLYPCGRPDTGDTGLEIVVMGGGQVWDTGGWYDDPCGQGTTDTGGFVFDTGN